MWFFHPYSPSWFLNRMIAPETLKSPCQVWEKSTVSDHSKVWQRVSGGHNCWDVFSWVRGDVLCTKSEVHVNIIKSNSQGSKFSMSTNSTRQRELCLLNATMDMSNIQPGLVPSLVRWIHWLGSIQSFTIWLCSCHCAKPLNFLNIQTHDQLKFN